MESCIYKHKKRGKSHILTEEKAGELSDEEESWIHIMKVVDIKHELCERGLPVFGNKAELRLHPISFFKSVGDETIYTTKDEESLDDDEDEDKDGE